MDRSELLSDEELKEISHVRENMWRKYPPMAHQPVAPFPYRMSQWPDEFPPEAYKEGEQLELFPETTDEAIKNYTANATHWTAQQIQSISDGMVDDYIRAIFEGEKPDDVQVGGAHYKKLGIQVWDFVAANDLDYFQGSIIKYVTRAWDKGGIEDLKKARHFLDKYIEIKEGE